MQKVKTYNSLSKAQCDMNIHLREGWRVHTCTMSTYKSGYTLGEMVLVVYEKESR